MTTTKVKSKPCREYRGSRFARGGYGRIYTGGRQVSLHRWVVETVEGRPLEPGELVMHTCDNPPCFLYEHLRRGTDSDNQRDAVAKGRHRTPALRGEANKGGGKLTEDDVRSIRERHMPGRGGNRHALAAEFGVTPEMIRLIVKGSAWTHVQ